MFWGSITEERQQLMFKLLEDFGNLDSEDINHKYDDILDGATLSWFQSFCVQHAIISKGSLISLPTGTGKTFAAMAFIKAIRQDYIKDTKSLFICIPSSVEQIVGDFKEFLDLRVCSCSGEFESIQNLINTPITFVDSYVISSEALYSIEFCNWFVEFEDFIDIVILDEAHEYSQDSMIRSILKQLFKKVEYKVELTATPLTVDPLQPLELINMMDPDTIEQPKKYLENYTKRDPNTFEVIGYEGLSDMSSLLFPHYVSWTRKELNIDAHYIPSVYLVDPTEEQRNATRKEAYKLIKMQKDSNQYKVLQAVIMDKTRRGLKGLIYAEHQGVCEMVNESLNCCGIKCVIANGTNSKSERKEVIRSFKANEVNVAVTSLTTSLNLSCDYVVFMENTNLFSQMLGRPVRGFIPKDVEVGYILTEDTVEIDQFYDNVFKREEYLRDMLGKDIEVSERLTKAIKRRNL